MVKKNNETISTTINYLLIAIFSTIALYPFLLMISGSFMDEKEIMSEGFKILPSRFVLDSYKYLWINNSKIIQAYKVTIFTTVVGTFSSLLLTALTAYPLSRRDLKYRNIASFYIYFTMLFNGGYVPWYLVCTQVLGLRDNLFALFIPGMLSAWNVFLLRNFFKTIPESLFESAKIDGATEMKIFMRIILPLSLPGMATIGLFISLGYWNGWFVPLMLINKSKLWPLQLILRQLQSTLDFLRSSTAQGSADMEAARKMLPSESIKLATTVITIGPIILVYPFIQKYFVKGLTIGAIKG